MDLPSMIKEVQAHLARRGLYTGKIDGLAGSETWAAISSALIKHREQSKVTNPFLRFYMGLRKS